MTDAGQRVPHGGELRGQAARRPSVEPRGVREKRARAPTCRRRRRRPAPSVFRASDGDRSRAPAAAGVATGPERQLRPRGSDERGGQHARSSSGRGGGAATRQRHGRHAEAAALALGEARPAAERRARAPGAPARRAAAGSPAAWPRRDRTCRTTRGRWPRSACGSRRSRRCRSRRALPSWPARRRPPGTGAPCGRVTPTERPQRARPRLARGLQRRRALLARRRPGPAGRRTGRRRASSPARRPSTTAGSGSPRRGPSQLRRSALHAARGSRRGRERRSR